MRGRDAYLDAAAAAESIALLEEDAARKMDGQAAAAERALAPREGWWLNLRRWLRLVAPVPPHPLRVEAKHARERAAMARSLKLIIMRRADFFAPEDNDTPVRVIPREERGGRP